MLLLGGRERRLHSLRARVKASNLTAVSTDLEDADQRSFADDGDLLAGGVACQRRSQPFSGGRKSGCVVEMREDRQNSDERESRQHGREEPDSLPAPS